MKKYLAIPALSAMFGSAYAAVPLAVTTALDDGLADAVSVAGLALIIVVGVAVFKYMRRAL
jgi:hypothetical protein